MARLAGLYKERAESEMVFIINKLGQLMEKGQEAQRELNGDDPLACAHWEDVGRDLGTLATFAFELTTWMAANAVPEPPLPSLAPS